ncbi:MAG: hypothetical protein J6K52_02775 [Clostridia bacterium]|nr:hypothetical protein [Clostridia bacterium]
MGFFSKLFGKKQTITSKVTIDEDAAFQMVIEDVFDISGVGTVVTGLVTAGSVNQGDLVKLSCGIDTVVKKIQCNRTVVQSVCAGQNAGLVIEASSKVVKKGMTVTK